MHSLYVQATIADGGQHIGANSASNSTTTTVTEWYQCIVDCCNAWKIILILFYWPLRQSGSLTNAPLFHWWLYGIKLSLIKFYAKLLKQSIAGSAWEEKEQHSFATLDKKSNDVYDLTKHFPILLDHIFLTNLMCVSNMVSKLLNTSTNLFAH